MNIAVAQRPVSKITRTNGSTVINRLKKESPRVQGAESGMPAYLQSSPISGSNAMPVAQRLCDECETGLIGDSPQVQPKFTIGAPDDIYEKEADQVSERVQRLTDVGHPDIGSNTGIGLQRKLSEPISIRRQCNACGEKLDQPVIQRLCTECAAKEDESGGGTIQRKSKSREQLNRLSSVQRTIDAPGSGRSLSPDIRARSEAVLDSDLSGVRVHDGKRANQAANNIGARAFTYGNNIFLGEGQSSNDLGLMAHELTHTVQQGASPKSDNLPPQRVGSEQAGSLRLNRNSKTPDIQKLDWPDIDIPSPSDVWDAAESTYEAGTELASDAYDAGAEVAGDAYDAGAEVASDVYDAGAELAGNAYDAVAGIATEVWDTARAIASALGGSLSLSGGRLTIVAPPFRACPTVAMQITLPSVGVFIPLAGAAFPIAPNIAIYGALGVNLAITPEISAQLGPCQVHGLRLVIDPLRGNYSAVGRVSVTTAFGLGAEASAGLRGEVGAIVVLPTIPPIPLPIPGVGLEAGIAAQIRGTSIGTTDASIAASFTGSGFSGSLHAENDAGLALDMGLGAYGQLDVLGINLCRLYWPLAESHEETAMHYVVDAALNIGRSGFSAGLRISKASPIPFDTMPMEINREVLSDDCVLLDALCEIISRMNLMPSLNGGNWNGHPSPPWEGPLDIFPRDPSELESSFRSGAKCRGACGADCDTCSLPEDKVKCVPGESADGQPSHDLWVYPNYQICDSHQGCRDHDGCYDWCGSGGPGGIGPMLCRRLCDIECMCDYRPSQCINWVFGGAPHDRQMVFSDAPHIGGSCNIPCPPDLGDGWGGGESAEGGSGGANPNFGGGAGMGATATGGGNANNYSICLPTLELFGRLPWKSDVWSESIPDTTIWSQWIELPPPVFLASLDLKMQGYANAEASAGLGPATIDNVCFGVDLTGGLGNAKYLATGALSIEADFKAILGLGGKLCTNAAWLGILNVASGCVGIEATGTLSLRANLDAVLQARSAEMSCQGASPILESDLSFILDALLDFGMDATFRLSTIGDIELYSHRWNLVQAQWAEKWGNNLKLNKNPFGDPTIDLRSHRFTLGEIADLLLWLFSDDAEEAETDENETKAIREDPLTAATARTIPSINSQLDQPQHTPSSLTLVGGSSSVGVYMISRFITDQSDNGSETSPRVQPELYGYGKLPTSGDLGPGRGQSKSIQFIKGHLLNYHDGRGLGGFAITRNLYPITGLANARHNSRVEEDVKDLVYINKLAVMYEVQVANVDGPHEFNAFANVPNRPCMYQYINADFVCKYATYRLYSDDSVKMNDPVNVTIHEVFDLPGFVARMVEKDCPKGPTGTE